MPPPLAQPIPVKLREIAYVRSEEHATVTCCKPELTIIYLAVHACLE
jgi:hypothetical protein